MVKAMTELMTRVHRCEGAVAADQTRGHGDGSRPRDELASVWSSRLAKLLFVGHGTRSSIDLSGMSRTYACRTSRARAFGSASGTGSETRSVKTAW